RSSTRPPLRPVVPSRVRTWTGCRTRVPVWSSSCCWHSPPWYRSASVERACPRCPVIRPLRHTPPGAKCVTPVWTWENTGTCRRAPGPPPHALPRAMRPTKPCGVWPWPRRLHAMHPHPLLPTVCMRTSRPSGPRCSPGWVSGHVYGPYCCPVPLPLGVVPGPYRFGCETSTTTKNRARGSTWSHGHEDLRRPKERCRCRLRSLLASFLTATPPFLEPIHHPGTVTATLALLPAPGLLDRHRRVGTTGGPAPSTGSVQKGDQHQDETENTDRHL